MMSDLQTIKKLIKKVNKLLLKKLLFPAEVDIVIKNYFYFAEDILTLDKKFLLIS